MADTKTPRRARATKPRPTTEIAEIFPWQGQWTESEFLDLPDTNRIVELSNGKVVIPDMPTTSHQDAVLELAVLLRAHVKAHDLGRIAHAPLRVRLWPGKIREPDIVFMSKAHAERVREQYWGVPDLVVEVISPRTAESSGTEKADREEKFEEYASAEVPEYWIVDHVAPAIEVYALENGAYALHERAGKGGSVRSRLLPGLSVAVDAVFP